MPLSAWHPPTRPCPCRLSLQQYGSLEQGQSRAFRAALVAGLDRQVLGFGFSLEDLASWLLRGSYYSGEKRHEGKSMGRSVYVSLSLSLPCGSPEEMQLLGQELLGFAVFLDLARGR